MGHSPQSQSIEEAEEKDDDDDEDDDDGEEEAQGGGHLKPCTKCNASVQNTRSYAPTSDAWLRTIPSV